MEIRKQSKQYINTVVVAITIVIVLLTIGWSAFKSSMLVDSYAFVRNPSEVRVTGFALSQVSNDGIGTYEDFGVDYITADATLPNANSTITYEVQITNMQLEPGVNVGIFNTSSLPEGISILSWDGYNLKDKICDNNNPTDCGIGAQKTFYITIGYTSPEYYDSSKTDFKFDLTFNFREFHNISYSNITGNYPDSIIDGDDLSITLNDVSLLELQVNGNNEYINGFDFNYNDNELSIIEVHEDLLISKLPSYTIIYDANGGIFDNDASQTTNIVTYVWRDNQNKVLSGTEKVPTNGTDAFYDWYTDNTNYSNIFDKTIEINQNRTVYAKWIDKIAEKDGIFYDTLQQALASVKSSDGLVTIKLLKNTSENLSVGTGVQINLNLQGYTVTNKANDALLTNKGQLKIYNGSLISKATNAATINNEGSGSLVIEDANVMLDNSKGKQALYSYGNVDIYGNSVLSSSSTIRATVQTMSGSTLTMHGGSVLATGTMSALNCAGNMIFGEKDGSVSTSVPLIQGANYGIEGVGTIKFYDGIIKGKVESVANLNKINDKEEGLELIRKEEVINGNTYKILYLDVAYRVTFNPNGGVVSESFRAVSNGDPVGTLPEASRSGYIFDGWFTAAGGGTEVLPSMPITQNETFYAHWTRAYTVSMNGNNYYTISDAITAAPNGTKATITLLRDASENLAIPATKNIYLDLNSFTLKNSSAPCVVDATGRIEITNGTIFTNSPSNAAINVEQYGYVIVNNANVTSSGLRQAMYIYGEGTAEIKGDSYLFSETSGSATGSSIERGTVTNLKDGTLIITGGTIVGKKQQAVSNEGNMIIGTLGDGIDTTTPVFIGETYGIKSLVTFEYYDGIAKGITNGIYGETTIEENTVITSGTEVINGKTYKTQYLESTE